MQPNVNITNFALEGFYNLYSIKQQRVRVLDLICVRKNTPINSFNWEERTTNKGYPLLEDYSFSPFYPFFFFFFL